MRRIYPAAGRRSRPRRPVRRDHGPCSADRPWVGADDDRQPRRLDGRRRAVRRPRQRQRPGRVPHAPPRRRRHPRRCRRLPRRALRADCSTRPAHRRRHRQRAGRHRHRPVQFRQRLPRACPRTARRRRPASTCVRAGRGAVDIAGACAGSATSQSASSFVQAEGGPRLNGSAARRRLRRRAQPVDRSGARRRCRQPPGRRRQPSRCGAFSSSTCSSTTTATCSPAGPS